MTLHDKADLAIEQESMSVTSSAVVEADFQSLCTGVTLNATEAVHIAFDGEVATTGSFLLLADTMLDLDVKFTKINAIAVSTTAILYIMARR